MNSPPSRSASLESAEFAQFRQRFPERSAAHRAFAHELYRRLRWHEAVAHIQQALNLDDQLHGRMQLDDVRFAARICYALEDYPAALRLTELALADCPDDIGLLNNRAIVLRELGRYHQAKDAFLQILARDGNHLLGHDGLAHVYTDLGRFAEARQHGQRALRAKDREAFSRANLQRLQEDLGGTWTIPLDVPPWRASQPGRNVISFSLWGQRRRYLQGAVFNARIAPVIYPGWSCRFYHDPSVPTAWLRRLRASGAQLVEMPSPQFAFEGLFWRFAVADEPQVDRYLIRDCDSVLNCQERVAVDCWLQSDKHFHAMRDYPNHSELILAGLWGGVQGALPEMRRLIQAYVNRVQLDRTVDQRFLRERVWPLIKDHCLVHDSQYAFAGAQAFPELGRFPDQRYHVGADWFGKSEGDGREETS